MISADDLRLIKAIAQSASLAAAGRTLDVTPAAVSQRLSALESRLGVRLVQRGKRSALTSDGRAIADRAAVILKELDELESSVLAGRGKLHGQVRVLASFGFGRRYVAPLVTSFRALHPAVSVDLQLVDKVSAEQLQGPDLCIHVGTLRAMQKIAIPLAPNARFICASPAYLARRGAPKTLPELQNHECIALRENDDDATLWRVRGGQGNLAVRIAPTLSSNDGEVVRNWALAGLGVIMRSEWDVAEDLSAGRLVRILTQYKIANADVVALVDSREGLPERVHACIKHMKRHLTPPPWRRALKAPDA